MLNAAISLPAPGGATEDGVWGSAVITGLCPLPHYGADCPHRVRAGSADRYRDGPESQTDETRVCKLKTNLERHRFEFQKF